MILTTDDQGTRETESSLIYYCFSCSNYFRTSLTKQAEKESVDLFMMNLYRLLLTPPVRGMSVLGLDPGFSHGCKLAVLSTTGEFSNAC